ncbi:uncharacterized protein LOC117621761 [Prunus dulcis]|uniref:uncharacterized protein LOC117621761 n=1 Tax=Prunus dulcis TaxID=3755 RepID=UPI001482D18A|nr:uncharacterized protein LOC117621761 [Prunus dulcis]
MENVNMACPKDSFPLSRIDQLVDATAGHELLSFMDAYSGYNQIRMHLADQESTRLSLLKGCDASLVLISPSGITVEYAMPFHFQSSNNKAEYEALLAGLRLAKELGAKHIYINSDSQLVVNQVTDEYQARGQ